MTDRIMIKIDGAPVEAQPGDTILEAATRAGIHIPTLCADPNLPPYGACRLCIVRVSGVRGLPPACTTTVADGMAVVTDDEEISEVRKTTVQLLLSDHPTDCLACTSNAECELQDVAAYLGVRERRYVQLEREGEIDGSNPFFDRDPNKCVLCGRCVRACQEIVGTGAIDVLNRGFASTIGPFLNGPLADSRCEGCGECVVHCPTGSLGLKQGLPPDKQVQSVCPYCGTGCSVLLGIRANKVVSVEGDPDGPVNRGQLCVKGRFGLDFVDHPDRLTTPLIRKDGELVEASWDEALDLIASKAKDAKGGAFAAFASAKTGNEDNYVLQKFTRQVMGTNSIDHCARL